MNFKYESNRIYVEDAKGQVVAEITFPETSPGVVNINHTFVDHSLRGQGVAGKLMSALVEKLSADGLQATCTCSYAIAWFKEHPEYQQLLQN